MSNLKLIHGSCADQNADAVVNAANSGLWEGGGICGVIFSKCGSMELAQECSKIQTPVKDGWKNSSKMRIQDIYLHTNVKMTEKIGCKSLFAFAIDTPKLISYYKDTLGFMEITDTDEKQFFEYAVPDYYGGCRFLYFPLA